MFNAAYVGAPGVAGRLEYVAVGTRECWQQSLRRLGAAADAPSARAAGAPSNGLLSRPPKLCLFSGEALS